MCADALLDTEGIPSVPAAGQGLIWVDTYGALCIMGSDGVITARQDNASTASQGAGFAADTYVTGSSIRIPSFSVRVGSMLRWVISVSKTAAGVATPIYQVRIGPNQTTADTSRLTLTGSAQTAGVDIAIIHIFLTVRSVSATGVIQGTVGMFHNTGGAGFAATDAGAAEGTSAGFDNTALGGQYIGLSINGGASAAWTITQCRVEAKW
jgi:hypothetical protein